MYDFDNKEKNQFSGKASKRASVFELMEQFLYEEVVAREDIHKDSVTMSDLVYFFMSMREKYPEAEKCLIFYKEMQRKYVIYQVMLDADEHELRKNNKMCIGRKLVVDELGESVLRWFDGKTSNVLTKENMF